MEVRVLAKFIHNEANTFGGFLLGFIRGIIISVILLGLIGLFEPKFAKKPQKSLIAPKIIRIVNNFIKKSPNRLFDNINIFD